MPNWFGITQHGTQIQLIVITNLYTFTVFGSERVIERDTFMYTVYGTTFD